MSIFNILLGLEIVFLSYFFAPFPRLKIGSFCGITFSLILIFATSFHNEIYKVTLNLWENIYGKIFVTAVFIILFVGFVYIVLLTSLMVYHGETRVKNVKDNHILIILGCRIKATGPTRMLKRRLDTALEYLNANPNVRCIVSGGQGKDENVSEALAMEDYLISNGIERWRILKENKSTSTFENFKFSLEITKSLKLSPTMIVVTDGFHQYRAKLIAEKLNIKTTALSSKTEPRFLFIYWIRELLALTKFFLKVNKT